jgi:hypothetical protein
MTEQRVREIIREELAAGCPPWADSDPKPTINRDLRGWVLVTDEDGDEFVRWATWGGVAKYKHDEATQSWEGLDSKGWNVEPFPTGYSEEEVGNILKDHAYVPTAIHRVLNDLRRLKGDT